MQFVGWFMCRHIAVLYNNIITDTFSTSHETVGKSLCSRHLLSLHFLSWSDVCPSVCCTSWFLSARECHNRARSTHKTGRPSHSLIQHPPSIKQRAASLILKDYSHPLAMNFSFFLLDGGIQSHSVEQSGIKIALFQWLSCCSNILHRCLRSMSIYLVYVIAFYLIYFNG